MESVSYLPFGIFQRGIISKLLKESYSNWNMYEEWHDRWVEYDNSEFDNPGTIGACGFVTVINDISVGMISWDPRNKPYAIIGHNCIIPSYRNRGLGQQQLARAVEILKDKRFSYIRVSTGNCSYFMPARKMYQKGGFKECKPYRYDEENLVYYQRNNCMA